MKSKVNLTLWSFFWGIEDKDHISHGAAEGEWRLNGDLGIRTDTEKDQLFFCIFNWSEVYLQCFQLVVAVPLMAFPLSTSLGRNTEPQVAAALRAVTLLAEDNLAQSSACGNGLKIKISEIPN